MRRALRWLAVAAPVALWVTPPDWLPLPGLTVVEHRLLSIFVLFRGSAVDLMSILLPYVRRKKPQL